MIHIILHFAVPAVAARFPAGYSWKKNWFIMAMTMLVDLDHLLATPVYDPARCSIGFHPLHSYPAIILYLLIGAVSSGLPWVRLVAIGLLIHMGLDGIDCL